MERSWRHFPWNVFVSRVKTAHSQLEKGEDVIFVEGQTLSNHNRDVNVKQTDKYEIWIKLHTIFSLDSSLVKPSKSAVKILGFNKTDDCFFRQMVFVFEVSRI